MKQRLADGPSGLKVSVCAVFCFLFCVCSGSRFSQHVRTLNDTLMFLHYLADNYFTPLNANVINFLGFVVPASIASFGYHGDQA